MQHLGHRERSRIGKAREHLARGGLERGERLGVGRNRAPRGGERRVGHAAIDLAAREPRRHRLAQHRLERTQLLGDARLELEIAMIDRLQLDGEASLAALAGGGGETGHAGDHREASI